MVTHGWSNTAASGDALNIFQGTLGSPFNLSNNITAGATNGSSEIFLGNASTVMTVGTYEVAAYQMPLSTTGIPATSGAGGLPYPIVGNGCNDDANFLHGGTQIITVTNVISNTDIKFTPPLRWNLMTNQPFVIETSYCQGVGVENINFTFSQAGTAIRNLIEISLVQNCWVTGCTLSNTLNNAIRLGQTSHTLIQSNIIEYAWDYVGGYGYGVWEFECESDDLIVNNIFQNLRHAYAAEGWVSGTVVAYNYETNELFRSASGTPINAVSGSYITHAIGSEYILFEGNFGDFVEYDNIQGDGQLNTSFRNRLTPITHNSDWPGGLTNQNGTICFTIYTNNQFESVIGNVLGLTGVSSHYQSTPTNNTFFGALIYAVGFSCDNNGDSGTVAPNCLSNLLRSVNYDYVNNAIVSDAGIDTNLPNSYYLGSKPSWWTTRPWPSIGPDLAVMTSPNPAMDRFYGLNFVNTNLVLVVTPTNASVTLAQNVNYNLQWQTNGVTDIAPQNGNNTLTVYGINIIGVDSASTLVNGAYNHNQAATIAGSTNVYGVAVYNGLTLTSNIVPLSQTNTVIPPPATNIFYPRFYSPLLFFPDYYIGTNATGLFVTSGAHGSAITPLDGSTISNFDFNMENIPANVTIHILTGTNLTMGGMSWHPKTGQNISGAGTNATFLQFPASLVANGTIADALIIQSVGATHGVTLSNLTLDCDYQVGVTKCRLRGATLLGNSNSMFRVKLINAASYSGTYSECFGLNEFADSAGNGNGCWFNDCTVDNYTCNSNNNLSAINMTGLYNSGYTNCHVWQRDTNSPVYGYSYGGSNIWINSCYGNGLSTFTSDDSLPGRTNCGWINCYATNITQFLNWKSGAESSILISNCVGYLSRQRPGDNGTFNHYWRKSGGFILHL